MPEATFDDELVGRARDWIADDPDPETRAELDSIVEAALAGDAEASADLADRFAGTLTFGTAGLRGELGPGPNRMNLAVVIRAAAGIARWIRESDPEDGPSRGVAVCFDARRGSRAFAEATAEVLAAAGIRALVLPGPLPTPVLAFVVRHLGTAAGVMVTASHNPARDNGYKVYDGSGRQIVAPTDAAIAAGIAAVERVSDVERTGPDDPDIVRLDSAVVDAYVRRAAAVGRAPETRSVRLATTALHGVGAATLRRVLAAAGFDPPVEVPEQADPDPDFPTVAFPNPEEPGALDRAVAVAATSGADVLLANDPDADRLGVAVPDPTLGDRSDPAGWRILRGDEIGVILADHLLRHGGFPSGAVLATTIVSSTLLSRMAASAGFPFRETLTGFKWITRAPREGETLGFGYEEALGYCVGDVVADKDGMSAAVVFAEAVAVLAAQGRTVLDVLDDLAREHGVHLTGQWSARVEGSDGMTRLSAAMDRLRASPPSHLAGRPVARIEDLLTGGAGSELPPSDVLVLHLDGGRVVVRPSGTEPKLKCYVEVVQQVVDADMPAARSAAETAMAELIAAIAAAIPLS
ncbi:MAG: phospho-sugar mutase [Acidimicrobiales bacterium]|nr:phospho-sugar mutase [Acidimicrobiales bacterium]